MKRLFKFHTIAALIVFVVAASSTHLFGEDDYGIAMDQTATDFKKVVADVKDTREKIDKTGKTLDTLAALVMKTANNPARRETLAKIKAAQEVLESTSGVFEKFESMSETVTKPMEIWKEVNEFKSQLEEEQRNQGNLAVQMRLISTLMNKYGGDVPLIGGFIEAYGQLTNGILDATNKLAQTIDKNRNQDMVGDGSTSTGVTRNLNKLFEAQAREQFLRGLWAPAQPPWVYALVEDEHTQIIWDAQNEKWYPAPKGSEPSVIFRLVLLAGKYADPPLLLQYCQRWEKSKVDQAAAREIEPFLIHLDKSMLDAVKEPFIDIYFHKIDNFIQIWKRLTTPELFEAHYMYDRGFHARLNQTLGELYLGWIKDDNTGKEVDSLVALAKRYNIREVLDLIKPKGPRKLLSKKLYYKSGKLAAEYSYYEATPEEQQKQRANFATIMWNNDGGNANEIRQGTKTTYFEGGKVEDVCQFENGEKTGLDTEYHENGTKSKESTYVHDVQEGPFAYYDQNGRLTDKGVQRHDGWVMTSYAYYDSGAKKSEIGYASVKDNGFTEKMLHGSYTTWLENGEVATKGAYNKGKCAGFWQTLNQTNDWMAKGSYDEEGRQTGPWEFVAQWSLKPDSWDRNRINKGAYKNGVEVGIWVETWIESQSGKHYKRVSDYGDGHVKCKNYAAEEVGGGN